MATWDKDVPPLFGRQGRRGKVMRYLRIAFGGKDASRTPRIGGEDGTGLKGG